MTARRGVSLQPYGGHTSTAALRAMLRQIKNHFAKRHAAIGALRRAHLGREIVIGKKNLNEAQLTHVAEVHGSDQGHAQQLKLTYCAQNMEDQRDNLIAQRPLRLARRW